MEEQSSTNTSSDNCRLCDKTSAVLWYCIQCREGLCEQCHITHGRIKALVHHRTLSVSSSTGHGNGVSDELLDFVAQQFDSDCDCKCRRHKDNVSDHYCMDCHVAVCKECIQRNHDAHDNILISEFIEKKIQEMSKYVIELKKRIKVLDSRISKIQDNAKEYSQNITQLETDIVSRGRAIKEAVDDVVAELIADLRRSREKTVEKFEITRSEMEQYKIELKQILKVCGENINNKFRTIRYMSVVKEILEEGFKFTDVKVEHYEKLSETRTFDITQAKTMIKDLIGISKTGNLSETVDLSSANRNDKRLHHTTLVSSFNLPKQSYRVFVADSQCAFVVEKHPHKEIFKVTKSGDLLETITSDDLVYDIAMTSSNELVLTSGNCIRKVTEPGKLEEKINFSPFYTKGLALADKDILVCLYRPGNSRVVRLTTAGKTVQTIQYDQNQKELFKKPQYLAFNAVSKDIAVIDDNKVVIIVDKSSNIKSKYQGPTGQTLEKPVHFYGVVCDMFGDFFISDRDNSLIHQLDKDGQFLRYILTKNQGIVEPIGVGVSTTGELWICNKNGEEVYVIKYLT